jgi:transposase
MSTTQTVPQDKDTAIQDELYMSFELGDKSWKVTISAGHGVRVSVRNWPG